MKKLLLAALAAVILVPGLAVAGQATLSWTHPTTNNDESPLPLSGIARTEAQYAKCNAARTGFLSTSVPTLVAIPAPPASGIITGLATGTWCFQVRTVSTGEVASVWTGMVNTAIVDASLPAIPAAPANPTVRQTSLTVYSVVKRLDRFLMVAVGTAPAGTACVRTEQVNGYYVVPRAAVVWSGSVKPDVVVATCL
jgi:hypothetical protein